ncbi:major facilitator superfamily MFS_1 [Gloeothece citriformis PCC 7424]|uniref:Major facilitator superfamily MFS_1 n=1 Tax=Gloeothece citriformis (strain PCC 7424) TaxID=65393 RepID=B7KLG9_GLOC7|nr:MFS transporter [Gloeothece citriformis]ACK72541.1 major facilitator superfamily MFS_1 [Gloeothece citriformis PCC 7424]
MNPYKTFKTLVPEQRKNLLILFATGLLYWIGITIFLPILPLYVEHLGGTKQQIGMVMGSFAIGLILSRTWLGEIADYRGRKIVVIIGTIVAFLSPIGYLVANSIVHLIAVRAFNGISVAAFTTGYNALVTDLAPVKQRGEIIGYMNLSVPLGMALGPALGAILLPQIGYKVLFGCIAGLAFLTCTLSSQVREKNHPLASSEQHQQQNQPSRSFWQLLTSRSLFVPSLIFLLIGMMFGVLVTFLPLYKREMAGLFYSTAAIASFSCRIFVGQASDRYGRGLFISLSLICYTMSMVLLSISESSVGFIMAAILEGTGGGILIPMMLALISDRSYSSERGRVFAVGVSGFDVGIAISGPLLGFLNWEYPSMFALAASFAGIGFLLFITQSNRNIIHSLRFACGLEGDRYAVEEKTLNQ